MMKKSAAAVMAFIVLFACFALTVYADQPGPPDSYSIELTNSIFFYMPNGWQQKQDEMQAGLYDSKTLENIYLIDFDDDPTLSPITYFRNPILSKDGLCLVHLPWVSTNTYLPETRDPISGTALAFYKNGKLIQRYTVDDVLKDKSKGRRSASHVEWEKRNKRNFNAKTNRLTVVANDGRKMTFDMNTGLMVKDSTDWLSNPVILYAGAGIVFLVLGAVVFFYVHKRKFGEVQAE